MSKKRNAKLCAVKWCAAVATNGEHCPVHAKFPTLHLEYLAEGETFCEEMQPCEECDGSGECETCNGDGEHGHDCGKCDGTGKCRHCHGEGRVTFTKEAKSA